MLCKLHSVYKIIHCIHCVILHRGSQIIIHYTVKGQFFAFNLEKNYTRQKKFTQTPSVVSVTNIRYVRKMILMMTVMILMTVSDTNLKPPERKHWVGAKTCKMMTGRPLCVGRTHRSFSLL